MSSQSEELPTLPLNHSWAWRLLSANVTSNYCNIRMSDGCGVKSLVTTAVSHLVQDVEDDIRAVAADALLPAAAAIVAGQESVLLELKSILWNTLLTLEDLNLSTGNLRPAPSQTCPPPPPPLQFRYK
jgi:hypothetical protein